MNIHCIANLRLGTESNPASFLYTLFCSMINTEILVEEILTGGILPHQKFFFIKINVLDIGQNSA
jgi:hypothetical protein